MLKIKDFVLNDEDLFGYYCLIPTGCFDTEEHIYKVIGRLRSNCYKDIPAMHGEPILHDEIVDVVNVIHCGVCEEKVERYRLEDVKIVEKVDD